MHLRQISFAAAAALALALPAVSQEPMGPITQVITVKPVAGSNAEFEAGIKKHMAWHAAQKDSWPWVAYQVLSGESTGRYVFVSPGHEWKDFDGREKFEKADAADGQVTIAPFIAEETNAFYRLRPEISRLPSATASQNLMQVVHFQVSDVAAFEGAVKKIHEAIQKTKWGKPYVWHYLANGGEGPLYALVMPVDKWADLEPPEKTMWAMLGEVYGEKETAALMEKLMQSIRRETSELLRFRPDLSYIPGAVPSN